MLVRRESVMQSYKLKLFTDAFVTLDGNSFEAETVRGRSDHHGVERAGREH